MILKRRRGHTQRLAQGLFKEKLEILSKISKYTSIHRSVYESRQLDADGNPRARNGRSRHRYGLARPHGDLHRPAADVRAGRGAARRRIPDLLRRHRAGSREKGTSSPLLRLTAFSRFESTRPTTMSPSRLSRLDAFSVLKGIRYL